MKINRLQVPTTRKYIPLSTWPLCMNFFVRDCVKSSAIDIQSRFERGNHNSDGLDYTVFRLDWVINIFLRYSGIQPRVIDLLRQVKDTVTESLHTGSHVAETMFTGRPGRPKFNIPKEQLEFFIEQHFSTPAVADIRDCVNLVL